MAHILFENKISLCKLIYQFAFKSTKIKTEIILIVQFEFTKLLGGS